MEQPTPSAFITYLRSCRKESDKPISGSTTGQIPKWLKGSLIRVGAGLLEIGPDKCNHLFDGMALLHKFSFDDGTVTYQNRFLRSDAYKRNHAANRIVVSEFATKGAPDPCKTIFQRLASLFTQEEPTDNDLVNIVQFSEEVYALTETCNIWKIDPDNLESLNKVNVSKTLPLTMMIAHPHQDPDGTVFNIGSTYGAHSAYNIVKFPPKASTEEKSPTQEGQVLATIPASRNMKPCYYHSFAMTQNYFVLVEQPLFVQLTKARMSMFNSKTFADAFSWEPETQARFHVVKRENGELLDTRYVSKAFFVFHHINAYEEDGHLVIDMCTYDDAEIIKRLYVKALEEMFANIDDKQKPSYLVGCSTRYVLPLPPSLQDTNENLVKLVGSQAKATRQADGSIICEPEIITGTDSWKTEMPRINYEKNGKKYKFFYGIATTDKSSGTHLVKVDTVNRTTTSWNEKGATPSEPVFIANPESTEDEDSGVVVASLLFSENEQKVSLLILDARDMKEMGRVDFATESSVPGDFHGSYIPKP